MLTKNQATSRKAANLSIDARVLSDAKALDVNISRAAELGIAEAVRAEKNKRWLAENREALESSNAWVEKNGLPFAKYRKF